MDGEMASPPISRQQLGNNEIPVGSFELDEWVEERMAEGLKTKSPKKCEEECAKKIEI